MLCYEGLFAYNGYRNLLLPAMWTLSLFVISTQDTDFAFPLQCLAKWPRSPHLRHNWICFGSSLRYVAKLPTFKEFWYWFLFMEPVEHPIHIFPAAIAFFAASIGRLIGVICVTISLLNRNTLASITNCVSIETGKLRRSHTL